MPPADSTTRYFDMPDALVESARRVLEGDAAAVSTPRVSATVMLVRDAAAGVEVFVQRRRSSMRFAPGRTAFPGGGVDPRDADPELPWAGPSPAEWARALDVEERLARELVVAAAREVFEECGVLLATEAGAEGGGCSDAPDRVADRAELIRRSRSFGELLRTRRLVLRTDLLHPWAHWVTPEFEPIRHDTRFFVAALPAGQAADADTSEVDHADWALAAAVLADADAGRVSLLPPTRVCLEQLAAAPDVAALLASAPPMRRVLPVLDGTRLRVDLPRGAHL